MPDSEDSDQTGRMSRLISVFAGRTCHCVGFVTRWIICITNLDRKASADDVDSVYMSRANQVLHRLQLSQQV